MNYRSMDVEQLIECALADSYTFTLSNDVVEYQSSNGAHLLHEVVFERRAEIGEYMREKGISQLPLPENGHP